jgi:hypothetical protein
MIRISDRVWKHWEEVEQFDRPGVDLIFSSGLGAEQALAAVTRAADGTMRELEMRPPHPTREPFSTGSWSATSAPEGIALRIDEEPEDFEAVVRGIATRLEASGVDGALDLLAAEPAQRFPELVDLLECRLRVAGARHHFRGPNWGWRPEPGAFAAGVDAGIEWCAASTPERPLSLGVGLIAPVRIDPSQDVRSFVRQGLETKADVGIVRLTSRTPNRFRVASFEPSRGRVSLIEGGRAIANGAWQPALEGLRAFLQSAASWAVYGFVKRGSRRIDAELGSLFMDWVPVPHQSANSQLGGAFEDRLVPDAFGVQLLGEGYRGRIPEGRDWMHTAIGASAVLVEHVDPESWFDGRLVPFSGQPLSSLVEGTLPAPDLVERARKDFEPILFTDDVAYGR